MSISFGLGTNLSTSQKLTPQMQQAIKLLQMSSLELEQEVQMKLDSNPLLERVEEDEVHADDFDSLEELSRLETMDADEYQPELSESEMLNSDSYEDSYEDSHEGSDFASTGQDTVSDVILSTDMAHTSSSSSQDDGHGAEDTSDRITENTLGELEVDTNWDDVYTHEATSLASPSVQDMDDYHGATSANLQDHIRWQLNFKHLSQIDTIIAEYLIDAMDEYGFIQLDLDELEQSFDIMASFYQWEDTVDGDQIEMVLHVIQSCEPLGVGARNLAECLQIQLKRLPKDTPYREQAIRLLAGHEYLVSNNIKALIEMTGVQREEIADCLALIRTLNPSPGLAFTNAQPNHSIEPESYDIPDVLVSAVKMDDNDDPVWEVKLNPETLPKLRVNKEYANLVKRGDDSPDNVYLRDNLIDARLFIRSIEERNQNLLKVATCIVQRQQAFLLEGATAMKPLILKDVAEEVELHESTVSRLTTSKSILTPQGLFSLKHFFSSHVSSAEGDVSSTAICAMIEQMIEGENPKKPLSDSAIQKHLEQEGIEIARRTVAKYREAMNIGSSTQRKVKF